jgi:hypothetical protein
MFTGERTDVFTLDPRWQFRFFAWSLDVAGALGSERARQINTDLDESAYAGYEDQFEELRGRFDRLTVEQWNRNLYWSWLYSLKALLPQFGLGYQTYMQTTAWQDAKLATAMSSWAQLRHDTILYAKQPYVPTAGEMREVPMRADPAYVEPIPELYARLLASTRFAERVLSDLGVLELSTERELKKLARLLDQLLGIALKEVQHEWLTEADYGFIHGFPREVQDVFNRFEELEAHRTTLVADVLTDQNSGRVLEEATGNLSLLVVVNMLADGRLAASAGPVFTYYEFKQPINERLTDETWRAMVTDDPHYELMPVWTASFMEGRSTVGNGETGKR